jgi:hypothetical protein
MSLPRPRLGVRRRSGPHPVAATAEARVIGHELERRLGPLAFDLRIEADGPLGVWQPLAHAAWPADIDASIDPSELFGDEHPPLTALFARTLDARAVEVRRRMLVHLGLIDGGAFDDAAVAALAPMSPTPTDLWILVSSAPSVAVTDRAIAALATATDADRLRLDEAFDAVATRLRAHDLVASAAEQALARTRSELAAVRAQRDELAAELVRERRDAEAIIDQLGDRLAADQLAAES